MLLLLKNCHRRGLFPLGVLLAVLAPHPFVCLHAQSTRDPLDDKQVEEVRESGDKPLERVKLYIKFIEQRTAEIHKIAVNPRTQQPVPRLHNLMEEFTRLADELQDNLQTYSEQHADMRKTLKDLVEHSGKWKESLDEPKASPDYDFSRKTALETTDSTTELARKILGEQEKYFAAQKAAGRQQNAPGSAPPTSHE